jgi:GTP-binding protein Era
MNPPGSASFRTGTIAVIGRPNVGKSTLVNALVGTKVSIVSPRPQTTRHRLLGIASFPEGQLLLVDTPGIHGAQKRAMNRMMNRAARGAVEGVDAALLVIEAGRWTDDDDLAHQAMRASGVPCVLVINKVDKIADKGALLPFIGSVTDGRAFAAVHPVSAGKRKGLEPLVKTLLALVPEAEAEYAEDEITDRSERFLAGELVREQLFLRLRQEIPYATAVLVDNWEERPQSGDVVIDATILVERENQKANVVGKGGSMIKDVGTAARAEITKLLGRPAHLRLHVKVAPDWSTSPADIARLGYRKDAGGGD